MIEVKDEILNGEARYRIRDNEGNIILDNLVIEQITEVVQEATPLNKKLFDQIQQEFNNLTQDIITQKFPLTDAQSTIINLSELSQRYRTVTIFLKKTVTKARDNGASYVAINGIKNITDTAISEISNERWSYDDDLGLAIPVIIYIDFDVNIYIAYVSNASSSTSMSGIEKYNFNSLENIKITSANKAVAEIEVIMKGSKRVEV